MSISRRALVGSESADDRATTDGDIGGNQLAGHEIEKAAALQHKISGACALALIDCALESFDLAGSRLIRRRESRCSSPAWRGADIHGPRPLQP